MKLEDLKVGITCEYLGIVVKVTSFDESDDEIVVKPKNDYHGFLSCSKMSEKINPNHKVGHILFSISVFIEFFEVKK